MQKYWTFTAEWVRNPVHSEYLNLYYELEIHLFKGDSPFPNNSKFQFFFYRSLIETFHFMFFVDYVSVTELKFSPSCICIIKQRNRFVLNDLVMICLITNNELAAGFMKNCDPNRSVLVIYCSHSSWHLELFYCICCKVTTVLLSITFKIKLSFFLLRPLFTQFSGLKMPLVHFDETAIFNKTILHPQH